MDRPCPIFSPSHSPSPSGPPPSGRCHRRRLRSLLHRHRRARAPLVATTAVRRERREGETPAGDGRRGRSSSEDWELEIGGDRAGQGRAREQLAGDANDRGGGEEGGGRGEHDASEGLRAEQGCAAARAVLRRAAPPAAVVGDVAGGIPGPPARARRQVQHRHGGGPRRGARRGRAVPGHGARPGRVRRRGGGRGGSPYASRGAAWVSAAVGAVARAASDVGAMTMEKVRKGADADGNAPWRRRRPHDLASPGHPRGGRSGRGRRRTAGGGTCRGARWEGWGGGQGASNEIGLCLFLLCIQGYNGYLH
ncbi:hypothetical protein PVAP13_3NG141403 [Panicum virgatum]|uniref:Uncharacterized protein n=1 Tax=Panicum virgatum TaxID=38727 RepID=A0A8T0U428_PANVG|nr:hypothetical protein PVAP13_3NG141403 [Panicum virgatum]